MSDGGKAPGKERNIEARLVDRFLVHHEQIDEQGANAAFAQFFGDEIVARTEAAAAAAMREQHDPLRIGR